MSQPVMVEFPWLYISTNCPEYGQISRAVGPPLFPTSVAISLVISGSLPYFQGDAGPAEINVKVENLQPIKKAKRPSTLSFLACSNGGTNRTSLTEVVI